MDTVKVMNHAMLAPSVTGVSIDKKMVKSDNKWYICSNRVVVNTTNGKDTIEWINKKFGDVVNCREDMGRIIINRKD